jgi:two-component system, OmpR family, sensor histidine kinase QseC
VTEHWSLRARLLASLAALAALLFIISSLQSYLAYRETSKRLFDDSLRETASLFLRLAEHEMTEHGEILGAELMRVETRKELDGFQFQIWTLDMQTRSRLGSLAIVPLQDFAVEGFGWVSIGGERLRVHSSWNKARTMQIQIAQPRHLREALNRQALLRMIAEAVILIVIACVLIWWIVTASIKPLKHTADMVGQRSQHNLGPVDVGGAPREVRPLLDALNRLLQRVGETLQMERRFTADAAHELRTPLAAIRANAQVLVAARDAEERESTARDLIASVDRNTRLVEQLLSLARADQSAGGGHFQDLDLAQVVDDQLQSHRGLAGRLGIALTGALQTAHLKGDSALLAVLVRNLVDNALRYTPAGGSVRVSTAREEDAAVLVVEDTGPGIAPDEREKVFERFYRVAGPRATGSGLGLSIAQRIAELHGATIQIVAGPEGKGTRISVTLPLRR